MDTLEVIFWSFPCRVFEAPTRRSSGGNWSSWSVRAERLKSCRASSSRLRKSIINWVRQAERDVGQRTDGPTSAEREELIRLRRENQRLRQERDILLKAAAWFARESKANPSGFSGS